MPTPPPTRRPRYLCANCRYPLEGLESNECPECGYQFNPSDPSSFIDTQGPSTTRTQVSPIVGILLGGLAFAVLFTIQYAFISYWHDTTLLWFATAYDTPWWELNEVGWALWSVQLLLFGTISTIIGLLVSQRFRRRSP